MKKRLIAAFLTLCMVLTAMPLAGLTATAEVSSGDFEYAFYNGDTIQITSYTGDATTVNIPSEIIYLKDKEYGKTWSLNFSPMPDDNDYYIIYGFRIC